MQNRKDKLSRSKLLKTLQELQVENRKLELEMDIVHWNDLAIPLKLSDALQARTKESLYQMAQNIGLTKISALKKKELIDQIVSCFPSTIWNWLSWITEDHYVILRKLAAQGGWMSAKDIDVSRFNLLQQLGIVFTGNVDGKPCLVMTQEVVQEIKKIDFKQILPTVLRNTRWVKLTRGMLHYYGFLSIDDLKSLLVKYTGEVVPKWDISTVLEYALGEDDDIEPNRLGFNYFYVRDIEQVKQEHEMRAALDYYPFTEQQLLTAGEPDYIDRDESYLDFVEFLLHDYRMELEDADSIVEECMIEIRNGALPSDIILQLQEQMELDQMNLVQRAMDMLMPVYNRTRQWALKGYSPEGMSPSSKKVSATPHKADVINFTTRQKVGRNDPCPCGSGKKFKKCCGG